MSKCSKCGAEAKENARFCKACGAPAGDEALKDKKARVMSSEKAWVKPAVIALAVVFVLAAVWMAKGAIMAKKMGGHPMFPPHRNQSARLTNALPVKEQGGIVSISLAAVDDGKAHFYSYTSNGKTITFFVMKAADGSIRSAFDACMSCNHAKLGYRQEGGLVVCNNCGMGFNPGEIGKVTGGCNPIPLEKSAEGQMIVLKARDLEAGAQYF
jgi:uncharacterized membrane protein